MTAAEVVLVRLAHLRLRREALERVWAALEIDQAETLAAGRSAGLTDDDMLVILGRLSTPPWGR